MERQVIRAAIRGTFISLFALGGAVWSSDARADASSVETLSHEAKMPAKQNRYTGKCAELAESHRNEPTGERILDLAICHKEEGLLATAYYELREAMDIAQRDRRQERVKTARALLDEIEPKLPKLVVTIGLKASSIPGLEVKRDGAVVRPQEWGKSLPIDPGAHAVMAMAPGRRPVLKTVELSPDGTTAVVIIDGLEPKEEAAATTATSASTPTPTTRRLVGPVSPSGRDETAMSSAWSTQRKIGVAFGGVGVAALGVGTFLGFQAAGVQRDAEMRCGGTSCDSEGLRLRRQADDFSSASTMAFIGGGIMTAGGLLLYMTAPSMSGAKQTAGVTAAGVGPTGGWVQGHW